MKSNIIWTFCHLALFHNLNAVLRLNIHGRHHVELKQQTSCAYVVLDTIIRTQFWCNKIFSGCLFENLTPQKWRHNIQYGGLLVIFTLSVKKFNSWGLSYYWLARQGFPEQCVVVGTFPLYSTSPRTRSQTSLAVSSIYLSLLYSRLLVAR